MSQWVVVDDSDPSIAYSTGNDTSTEQWGAVVGSIPGDVDLDNAVFQTAHVLSSNGSLSLAFNGTQVQVFGVSSMLNLTKGDHIHNPSWTCSIDNISIPINASALSGFPWTSYCGVDGLNDQPHILNINITATQQRRFWLDYIRYVPLSTSPVANQTILVNATNPSINYPNGTQWGPVATAQFTDTDPSTVASLSPDSVSMSYTFNGTGITWFGLSLQSIVRADPSNTNSFPSPDSPEIPLITIDGVAKNVTVPATNQADTSYSHVLFSVDSLDPSKEHTLAATYKTNSSLPVPQPPLTLDFLLVQTGPLQGVNSPSSDPTFPGSTSSPIPEHLAAKKSKSHTGPILGAVLGFFFLLLLLILFMRFRRRRQISTRRARPHPSKTMDFVRDSLQPYGDDAHSPRAYESFPMRDADADDPFRAPSALNTRPQATFDAAAKTETGSRFIEDRSIASAAAPAPTPGPVSRTPEPFLDSPRQTVWSIESTSAPAEFGAGAGAGYGQAGVGTGSTQRSHAPSVSSATNPFRRMNQPSPSLDAAFGSATPGGTVRSPSNPFRGATLPPSLRS